MRRAFTLFEITISLVIVATTILAVVLIIPVGLRTQQHSRSTIYASAAALSLLDSFHHPVTSIAPVSTKHVANHDRVTQRLRNMGIHSGPYQPDMERAISRPYSGAIPLPDQIAARLDSDGDEIRKVLESGGQLYYLDPMFVRSLNLGAARDLITSGADMPTELHRLVFAVVGPSQQNALVASPSEPWPIYEIYPFPPAWLSYNYRAQVAEADQELPGPWSTPPVPAQQGTNMLGDTNVPIRYSSSNEVTALIWNGDSSPAIADAIIPNSAPYNRSGNGTPWVHGSNWISFQARIGGPWLTGWTAFQALAGDIQGGWLPILAFLNANPATAQYKGIVSGKESETFGPPSSPRLLPTYEMRASYRDRAINLWKALKPPAVHSELDADDPDLSGWDLRQITHDYGYSPELLRAVAMVAPQELAADPTAFPPHPSQVLALSYLAHAAMMVAAWCPPWSTETINDSTGEIRVETFNPWIGGSTYLKDGWRVHEDIAAGISVVRLYAPSGAASRIYRGDYLWFEDDEDFIYRVQDTEVTPAWDPAVITTPALREGAGVVIDVTLDKRMRAQGYGDVIDEDGGNVGSLHNPLQAGKRVMRVANDEDRAFARKIHEMCLRWATTYGAENPYDWGAPRPANRQIVTDRPLAMFDLWWDAGPYSDLSRVSGRAIRTLARRYTQEESFYRWIHPRNPWVAAHGWTNPAGAPNPHLITHQGPLNNPNSGGNRWEVFANHWATGRYTAPVASTGPGGGWLNADQERFWLNRAFDPLERTRRLVFWSVDWKSYEDAESLPSAVMDLAAYGKGIEQRGGDFWLYGVTGMGSYVSAGNPEGLLVWMDANRSGRWIQSHSGDGAWYLAGEGDRDLVLGHWGADRNNNGRFDIGPMARTGRMRAVRIADFAVYDPVLRLHARN